MRPSALFLFHSVQLHRNQGHYSGWKPLVGKMRSLYFFFSTLRFLLSKRVRRSRGVCYHDEREVKMATLFKRQWRLRSALPVVTIIVNLYVRRFNICLSFALHPVWMLKTDCGKRFLRRISFEMQSNPWTNLVWDSDTSRTYLVWRSD